MTTSVDIFFNLLHEDEVEAAHKIKTHAIRRVNAVRASVWQWELNVPAKLPDMEE